MEFKEKLKDFAYNNTTIVLQLALHLATKKRSSKKPCKRTLPNISSSYFLVGIESKILNNLTTKLIR